MPRGYNTKKLDLTAQILKALGHPVRLKIIEQLQKNGTCCCGQMCACFRLSQSTVSQHLSVLKKAGLIHCHRDGNHSCFSLDQVLISRMAKIISSLADDRELIHD